MTIAAIIVGLWSRRSSSPQYPPLCVEGLGCVENQPNPPPSASVDRALTDANNGETIELVAGQTFLLLLDTHSGGGYQYSLDAYDGAILRFDDHTVIEPGSIDAAGRPIVGAGNLEQWTFTAVKPGTTTIELTNFRAFEPRPAEPTFTVTIVVE